MGFLKYIFPLILVCFITFASTKALSAQTNCIIDITHLTHNNMTVFGKSQGAGQVITEFQGNSTVTGALKLGTHYGTHVDSPEHMAELASLGIDVPALDLGTLLGPVLVVRIPDNVNITGIIPSVSCS